MLSGLGNGTYYIDYRKEGYGTVRQYGIQLFGNDTARIGYICNLLEYNSGYLDTYLGVSLYSTLDQSKHSNVVSFIMP
jgi:hypothetical protein